MKFTYVFALAAAATVVSAETNAQRMARGLPPKAPARRGTPSFGAKRGSPSGSPGGSQCNTGPVQCCNSVQTSGGGNEIDTLLTLLGLEVPAGTSVGANCSPISAVGTGSGASCTQQPVCCENNNFNGLVNVGCSPVNINL
ncbi:hydrophobin [Paxillus ammoniavirescens]|nr:hydrophobin [Paxillus ammoniavirescens]